MRIRENSIEPREYQIKIFNICKRQNTLVVLPTGLGKTVIALLLAEHRLNKYPNSKVLMLAPTRPLVEQHKDFFREKAEGYFLSVTGKDRPETRTKLYERGEVIFATPQTIWNDIKEGRLSLENFSLVIFDEAHHATGNYAYVHIAREYIKQSKFPLILGLTATPGNSVDKILEVCRNLYIEWIEYRTEWDKDVRPYVKKKFLNFIEVPLDTRFLEIRHLIFQLMNKYRTELEANEILVDPPSKLKLKDLLKLQDMLAKEQKFNLVVKVAALIKLYHMYYLLTSQHPKIFNKYIDEILEDDSPSSNILLEEPEFKEILRKASEIKEHPKINRLLEILKENKGKKFIIFVQLRETAKLLKEILQKEGFKVELFLGQKEMSQRRQKEVIDRFERGIYEGIIATSIGEEGLHIPEVDLAIFYEPTPSVLRNIQRKGRVGRTKIGIVYILYAKNSPDQGYLWSTYKKEKELVEMLERVREILKIQKKKRTLVDIFEK